ncbi:L-aspartate oxidase [Sulfitobacter aestuarii]|uniref:L-aspartate oxidase n=1 Tax=Sulfitobacter aestuarii TaxID=2161676 RepID=A0ABW5U3Z2_9RHOB
MEIIDTERVIIIGAGLGALYAALSLAPRLVLLISPEALGSGASSAWAQGGVAAAMAAPDSAARHAEDTMRAGAGLVDPQVAAEVTGEARAHILQLTELGTPFDRTAEGGYVLSREAAHSFARVVRVRGDQVGAEIMRALVTLVRQTPSIQILEGVMAVALATRDNVVGGVELQSAGPEGSASVLVRGAACLLAGGGCGGLYALSTNPPRIRGQVTGMAARAGAVIADAEFVQFHPTAIDCGLDPAPLATEALRGAGAHLVNRQGERFMVSLHVDAELAPRDVVARAIYGQSRAGLRPMLDLRPLAARGGLADYPAVTGACASVGIDPARVAIPVAAAAHYHMGGVVTDRHGRSSLGGLWACGEVSATGLHGANRLASNGLLEALVYARRAASDIAAILPMPAREVPELELPDLGRGEVPKADLVARLRVAMSEGVGVIRDHAGLTRALREIARIEAAQPDCASLRNMTACATLIAAAALRREESRGAHCRSDFPDTDATARRSRLTLREALSLRHETETC